MVRRASPEAQRFPVRSLSLFLSAHWPEAALDSGGFTLDERLAQLLGREWDDARPPPGAVFAAVGRRAPEAASRFGAQARLGALAHEVTPLDRFTGTRRPRFTGGTLLDLGDVPDCRIFLTGEEDRLVLRIAYLRAEENRDIVIRLPRGLRAVGTGGVPPSADGAIPTTRAVARTRPARIRAT